MQPLPRMNQKSKWACRFSIQHLVRDSWAYLWTLTTPDEIDLKELSKRWRKLIYNGFTPCVRVFEPHTGGHGYHVHFVTAERIDVTVLRTKAENAGFGRIHVKRIPGVHASYIAKYLSKGRSAPGVRMWACVGFEGSKARDIEIIDTERDEISMVLKAFPVPSTYNFRAAWTLAAERHRKWYFEALKNQDNPDYEPPFRALYDFWVKSPRHSLGKPTSWWPMANTIVDQQRLDMTGGDK